jgi:Zinc finger protein
MLDFDRCKDMPMDKKGVEQAVVAFFRNDPYYPRPYGQSSRDQNLWVTFKNRYLKTSFELIGDSPEKNLPTMFITEVEKEQRRRMERRRDTTSSERISGPWDEEK